MRSSFTYRDTLLSAASDLEQIAQRRLDRGSHRRSPVQEDAKLENYSYKHAAIETWSIARLLEKHIEPCVGGRKVRVIRGDGEMPNVRTILRTLRGSYASE